MKFKKNLYPEGGYFFMEKDGTKLKSGSWRSLLKTIIEYRARNRLPRDNPDGELTEQICARLPNLCYEPGYKAPPNPTRVTRSTIKPRVIRWLSELKLKAARGGVDQVPEDMANARMRICMSCPKRQLVPGGCSACTSSIDGLRKEIFGKRWAAGDYTGCEHFGCDIPSAARLNGSDEDTSGAPSGCWRRKP